MITRVGFLISYDYDLLKRSLPLIYNCNRIDSITLAIDKDELSWSGNKINIPQSFYDWIEEFDTKNKITIYKDSFYVENLAPMECETRERNLLAKQMGEADWYLQIDADEYVVDIESIIDELQKIYNNRFLYRQKLTVFCRWASIFKEVSNGFLVINPIVEKCYFATNTPTYRDARRNKKYKRREVNQIMLHQSYGRSPEDVWMKLSNWGHTADFNVASFFKLWESLDADNCKALQNFHPLNAASWTSLHFVPAKNISDLTDMTTAQLRGLFAKRLNPLQRVAKKIFRV